MTTRVDANASLFARPYRALTIGATLLIAQIAFESLAVTTAMPTVARALNGLSYYAVAFGATLAASMVGMVVSGQWSDARGPTPALYSGIVAFTVGLLVAGFAPSMAVLILGRALQGFGGGQLIVALYVIVSRVYPPQLRPRVFAAFAGAWVVPSLVGPFLAGLMVQHLGWRWVFLGVALLVLPAAALTWPAVRTLHAPAPNASAPLRTNGNFRLLCAFGAAGCAALLHYAGHETGGMAIIALVVAFVGIAAFAVPLLPRGALLLRRGLPSVIALRGLAAGAYIAAEVFIPLMLSTERGWSPAASGLALTAGGVAWAIGSAYQGRFVPTHAVRVRMLRRGMGLTAFGIIIVACVVFPSVPAFLAVAGWGVAGIGLGLVFPTLSVLTLELSNAHSQGENSSALQLADAIVSTTALAIGGSLFAALIVTSATAAYLASYGVALALAVIGAFAASRASAVPANPE